MPPDVAATGSFAEQFTMLIEMHGLSMLFLFAILETSFVTGFLIPSGVATTAATILALKPPVGAGDAPLSLPLVAAVAIAGGFVGDTAGFWIGRWGDQRISSGTGRFAMLYRNRRAAADKIFGRHPFFSVTIARLISFVRTLMPMAAGMSTISYVRFLPYEIAGVTLWAAIYISIGFIFVEGWEAATHYFGLGGAVVLAVAGFFAWKVLSRRRARGGSRRPRAGERRAPKSGSGERS
jgi:membrane protein DedA with SNARE-associated domain